MKAARLRGSLPDWLRALDEATFGEAWGEPEPHEAVWVIEPAAFARWSLVEAAKEAELLRIAVEASQRGRGLGRALLAACEGDLAARGLHDLHLEVRVSNAAARALYEDAGWRPSGLREGYYRDGEDAVLYAKRIG